MNLQEMQPANSSELNHDAIYAGMVWVRENPWIFGTEGANTNGMTQVDLTLELFEEIYPDEAVSVQLGINLGRHCVVAPAMMQNLTEYEAGSTDPLTRALQRYLAEERHLPSEPHGG